MVSTKSRIDLEKVEHLEKRVDAQQSKVSWMQAVLFGALFILVVEVATLLVSVGAMYQQSLASKEASNKELVDSINEQNLKVELLYRKASSK